MALSFSTVEKTYKIFHAMKTEFFPDLRISSWPDDMGKWSSSKQEDPPCNQLLGWGKKYDNGWESISFFVKDPPSKEMIDRFNELAKDIPNTSICEPYFRNEEIWCFGWF